jgi:AcrR family transcriptional regulator
LLTTASAVFAKSGYAAATMQGVAKAARVTKPTLYSRFSDKAELYHACLKWEVDYALEYMFAAYSRAETLDTIGEIAGDVQAFFDYARDRPNGFQLIVEIDPSSPPDQNRQRFIDSVIDRILTRIVPGGNNGRFDDQALRRVTAMAVDVAFQTARDAHRHPQTDPQLAADMATSFIAGGIRSALRRARLDDRPD